MNRKHIVDFYKGANYKEISLLEGGGLPPRPREWNVPSFIQSVYHNDPNVFSTNLNGNKEIVINLDEEDLEYFKAVLLHESMFNFYKAYYNYLSALKLYDGGLLHWIEITSYYANFFLASSIVTLAGKTRYVVKSHDNNFVSELYNLVKPTKKHPDQYVIKVDINPEFNSGKLKINNHIIRGGSHAYIWRKYKHVNCSDFNITSLTYDYPTHLSTERNIENYSFDGYSQLDFNLAMEQFTQYFERDYVKAESNMIYTDETVLVLGVIGELYQLFNEFEIKGLPIEKEKLIYMSKYTLGDNERSEKLKNLINDGFPSENTYIDEYHYNQL